jgi:serine/threonine protein phosphatase PrpC
LEFHALTDTGRARPQNEDAFYANGEEGLFIVADGMGGASGGAVAAEIVVEVLPLLIRQRAGRSRTAGDRTPKQVLADALGELSSQLRRRSEGQTRLRGMGAAVVLAWFRGVRAWIGHLGDCRAYLCNGRLLELLTKDHTVVQMLLDSGELKPEEAPTHPARNQLTRYVGMAGVALPNVRVAELQPGDKLLLCSGGLTKTVNDTELFRMLKQRRSPRTICGQLIAAANEAGGADNVTALIVGPSEPPRGSADFRSGTIPRR